MRIARGLSPSPALPRTLGLRPAVDALDDVADDLLHGGPHAVVPRDAHALEGGLVLLGNDAPRHDADIRRPVPLELRQDVLGDESHDAAMIAEGDHVDALDRKST